MHMVVVFCALALVFVSRVHCIPRQRRFANHFTPRFLKHCSHSGAAVSKQAAGMSSASTDGLQRRIALPQSRNTRAALRCPLKTAASDCTLHSIVLLTISLTMANFDLFTGDFQFADFSNFSQPLAIDPSIQNPLPVSRTYSVGNAYTSPTSTAVSPIIPGFDAAAGKKRKHESAADTPSQPPADDNARHAAEEDKRRRNTAASARFRIKKKQREQALEKTAKEMTERVSVLETRIQQLETENTWLKGLITEKNGGKASPSEIQARLSKREESERSNVNRTDGVGTKASDSKA